MILEPDIDKFCRTRDYEQCGERLMDVKQNHLVQKAVLIFCLWDCQPSG